MNDQEEKDEKKKTSEKPISLNPLKFKEALLNLLRVRPKPKDDESEETRQDEDRSAPR